MNQPVAIARTGIVPSSLESDQSLATISSTTVTPVNGDIASNTYPLETLELPVLEEAHALGELYDAVSGTFLPGQNLVSQKSIREHHLSTKTPSRHFKAIYRSSSTLRDYCEILDIHGELSVTILIIAKASGSADYVKKKMGTSESASITAFATHTDSVEVLNFGKDFQTAIDEVILGKMMGSGGMEPAIKPTHIVAAVTYGKTLSLKITDHKSSSREMMHVEGKLAAKIDLAGLASIAGKIRVTADQQEQNRDTGFEYEMEGKGYTVTNQPKDMQEAANLYSDLLGQQGEAVPIRMILVPLRCAVSVNTLVCYELGQNRCTTLLEEYSEALKLQTSWRQLIGAIRNNARYLPAMLPAAETCVGEFTLAVSELRRDLSNVLSNYRRSGAQAELDQVDTLQIRFQNLRQTHIGKWRAIEDQWNRFNNVKRFAERIGAPLNTIADIENCNLDTKEHILLLIHLNPKQTNSIDYSGSMEDAYDVVKHLRRWRNELAKQATDSKMENQDENVKCRSLLVDKEVAKKLQEIFGATIPEQMEWLEVFVWTQMDHSSRWKWERVGERGKWHLDQSGSGFYIGEMIKNEDGRWQKHGKGQLFHEARGNIPESTFVGTWKYNKKHGAGTLSTGSGEPVRQCWKGGVYSDGREGLDWKAVMVAVGNKTLEVVLSPNDSIETTLKAVDAELKLAGYPDCQFWLHPPHGVRLPGVHSKRGIPKGSKEATMIVKNWGLGLPGSERFQLLVEIDDDATPSVSTEVRRDSSAFCQLDWRSVRWIQMEAQKEQTDKKKILVEYFRRVWNIFRGRIVNSLLLDCLRCYGNVRIACRKFGDSRKPQQFLLGA